MKNGEKGIFLRYSHGTPLLIDPNIKEKVTELIPLLKTDEDHRMVFRRVIEDIRDGMGSGIHPDSTWFAATDELFKRFEKYYDLPIGREVKAVLIGLLELLVTGAEGVDWGRVRAYLVDNIELLVPLGDRGLAMNGKEVRREADGKYYYDDDEYGVVHITGVKTPEEEALHFYTAETQMKYGRLYYLLRYVALFEIAHQYHERPEDFPELLSCTLYDNDYSTSYLDWQWQMPTPFDYVPIQWYPRSPYSNPEWLGSDLVMHLPYPNRKPRESILPNPFTHAMMRNWEEAFSGYKWQIEVPLNTNVLMGDGPEEYFDFLDRKVRVVNGNAFIQPLVIVPANEEDGSDGIEVARKFLSALNINNEVALSEQLIAQQRPRPQPWFRQTRLSVFQLINPEYALPPEDFSGYTAQKWHALAFMREAISSNSIYYSFLNYYKVIELLNKGNSEKTQRWINQNIERVCKERSLDWYQEKVIDGGENDPGFYLHKTERVAIAHAEYNLEGKNTHSPDSPKDWRRTQADLFVIRALAKDILKTI